LAEGETLLENCASEPEVEDLANLLNKMGASIEGAGTGKILIRGVAKLHGAAHTIIPDRIEAGTFLTAAAITGGHLTVDHLEPGHLTAVVAKLTEAGVKVNRPPSTGTAEQQWEQLEVLAAGRLRGAGLIWQEDPGLSTRTQAHHIALMPQAVRSLVIT